MHRGNSFHNAWRLPIAASTGIVPTIGQRLCILGGLKEFRDIHLGDGGFANDALWRLSPHVIWRHAQVIANNAGSTSEEPESSSNDMDPYHNGVNPRERRSRIRRSNMITWYVRRMQADLRNLKKAQRFDVRLPRRMSLDLGTNGVIGGMRTNEFGRLPDSSD